MQIEKKYKKFIDPQRNEDEEDLEESRRDMARHLERHNDE
jgi:hypothetical protein